MQPIVIQAKINVPVTEVWKRYTDPLDIVQWNFAHPSWCCPSASNDLRVGGKYMARMEARDGSFGFDLEAIYSEVNAPFGFVYILADGRRVSVELKELDDSTELEIAFDPESDNPLEMQRDGWQAILNNFKFYIESK